MSIINRLLSTVETLAESSGEFASARLMSITYLAIVLIAVIFLLILFFMNPLYAFGLIALAIGAMYLLDIDPTELGG